MSALQVPHSTSQVGPHLHLVLPGELSAHQRRRAHARAVARTHAVVVGRTWALLGTVTAVFGAAWATIAWAFWSIPNAALP
jgi:hypothetical protein